MNKWVKSFIFAIGITILMGCFMWVMDSPTNNQQFVPRETGNRWSRDHVVTLQTNREIPPMSMVLPLTFIGAYLLGVTIFKTKIE